MEDEVIELSFSRNNPVKLKRIKLGEIVEASIKEIVLINGKREYVAGITKGVLETYSYEGTTIVNRRRSLINRRIHSFETVIYSEEYYLNNLRQRKDYNNLKKVLADVGIHPNYSNKGK